MYKGDPIKAAQAAISSGTGNLFEVLPKAMRRIIKEKLWEGRTDKNGKHFDSFEAFVTHPMWHGLEVSSIDRLLDLVRDNQEVVALIRGEVGALKKQGEHSGNQYSESETLHNNVSKQGNSSTYLLKRLKRDAPDIAEDLIRGEYKSVRAAAIAAGIVKVPKPFDLALKQVEKMDRTELIDLKIRIESILKGR